MRRYLLGLIVAALGCASAPNANGSSARVWPGPSSPGLRLANSVTYGQPASLRLVSSSPVYVMLFELRPKLDSLDQRPAKNLRPDDALTGANDVYTSLETVDALEPATASMQATNCTIVKGGAGDTEGHAFCPISRMYGSASGRPWRFRNRVFMLISDQPFPRPVPQAIRWDSRGMVTPVAPGAKWTAIEL